MRRNKQHEQYRQWIAEICPQAISSMRDLLGDPNTPVNAKVTLIGMILDRTLGKAETPLRVMTDQDSIDSAEEQLTALVSEIGAELGIAEAKDLQTEEKEKTE